MRTPAKATQTAAVASGPVSEGPSGSRGNSGPQISDYCSACGHDWTRHRSSRCWTDAMGEPLTRTYSLIVCNCTDERTKP